MTQAFWKSWHAERLCKGFLVLSVLVSVGLAGCDPGAEVTWVNETDRTLYVYFGDDLDDFALTLRPRTVIVDLAITAVWEDVVVIRDTQDNVFLREEITWDELKARDFRFVIEEQSPPSDARPNPLKRMRNARGSISDLKCLSTTTLDSRSQHTAHGVQTKDAEIRGLIPGIVDKG
jgi:hypothetical protein